MSKNYQQTVKDLHNKGFTQSEIAYKIPEIPFPLLQKLMIKLRADDEVEEEEKRHWEFLKEDLTEEEEVEPKEYTSLIKLKKEERTNSIEEDIEEKYISLMRLEKEEKENTDDNSSEEE